MSRAAIEVDVAPVRRHADRLHVEAERLEQARRDLGGRAVGAVDDDVRAGERAGVLHDQLEMLDVMRREIAPLDRCRALGHRPALIGHQRFDGRFELFGELRARSAEHLDAVVFVGIVRRRDHDAGVEAFGARKIGDRRRRHHAGADHGGAFAGQAARQLVFDPRAGLARVAANHEAKAMPFIRLKPDTTGGSSP